MTVPEAERSQQNLGWIDRFACQRRDQWVRFWFTPADPASLGVLRILVGGMLIYSHLVWGINLPGFLGPDGWNSEEVIREFQKGQWTYSFWWDVPVASMQTVHQCCIGILALFCLGFLTRITSVLAFVIHVSYCQRASISTYGLDQIAGILSLYLMIGPCGAAYSIDGLFRRFWRWLRPVNDIREARFERDRRFPSAGLALRLIQVHYCVIYFFAAVGKSQGESWWTGAAMWQVIANYEYQSMDVTWLARFPEMVQLLTHIVFLWELSFAYLIWVRPLRPLMLVIGVLMHLGIGAFLGMWTFGLTMIFGYLAFLEPETVRSIVSLPLLLFQRRRSRN